MYVGVFHFSICPLHVNVYNLINIVHTHSHTFFNLLSFVGFSSGGLLARCIFMKLWNLPFFSAEILSYSLTCIMFGPLLQGNSQKFCDDCPDAFPYLHSFFLKDDFVPKIRFINEIMGFGLQHDTVVSKFAKVFL